MTRRGLLLFAATFTAGMGIGFALVLIGSTLATRRARAASQEQGTGVRVRDGSTADLDAVAAIRVSSWKDTYRPLMGGQVVDGLLDIGDHRRDIGRILSESQALLLVAEDGNHALAGFALSHIGADGEPFLESLHVQPGRRSHGIGAQLLQQTAARWAARGHRSMSLHVVESNLRAKRFYDRLGGREVGVVVDDWRGAQVAQAIYRWNDLAAVRDR